MRLRRRAHVSLRGISSNGKLRVQLVNKAALRHPVVVVVVLVFEYLLNVCALCWFIACVWCWLFDSGVGWVESASLGWHLWHLRNRHCSASSNIVGSSVDIALRFSLCGLAACSDAAPDMPGPASLSDSDERSRLGAVAHVMLLLLAAAMLSISGHQS
eukprot:m.159262 g.159262  ORF g.159262 m.159262 type:complete len:158 (+) comp17606_c0_seq19:2536-3009(+)